MSVPVCVTLSHSRIPVGQQEQGHGVVLHDQGEEYQQPIILKLFFMGLSEVLQHKILIC